MKAVQKQTLVCLIADAFLRVAVTARVKSSNFIDTDLFVHRSLLSVRFGFLIRFDQYDLISGPLWGETPRLKTINITTCVWRFFLTIFFFLEIFSKYYISFLKLYKLFSFLTIFNLYLRSQNDCFWWYFYFDLKTITSFSTTFSQIIKFLSLTPFLFFSKYWHFL